MRRSRDESPLSMPVPRGAAGISMQDLLTACAAARTISSPPPPLPVPSPGATPPDPR
jgi:hypothetical protein